MDIRESTAQYMIERLQAAQGPAFERLVAESAAASHTAAVLALWVGLGIALVCAGGTTLAIRGKSEGAETAGIIVGILAGVCVVICLAIGLTNACAEPTISVLRSLKP